MNKMQALFTSLLLTLASPIMFASPTQLPPPALTPAQVTEVQNIIHDDLVNHPRLMIEAIKSLQKYQINQQEKKIKTMIKTHKSAIFSSKTDPVLGNPKGDVILTEFLDYRCGHCKEMGPVIQELIQHHPEVKIIVKELPIFGKDSVYAAKVALASNKQGKFAALHESLLTTKGLNPSIINQLAQQAGLNMQTLNTQLKDEALENQLKINIQLAQQIGILGTPAFIISNKSLSQFKYLSGSTSLKNIEKMIGELSH